MMWYVIGGIVSGMVIFGIGVHFKNKWIMGIGTVIAVISCIVLNLLKPMVPF